MSDPLGTRAAPHDPHGAAPQTPDAANDLPPKAADRKEETCMNQIAIVYWSGTGNTETMARCIAEGVKEAGGQAQLLGPGEFSADRFSDFSAVAFGCSAMGAEQLEEAEFEPMFSSVEGALGGKKIALFGSYGWGDGQWMRDWCARCEDAGANLFEEEGLIAHEAPDAQGQEACRELGRRLAVW